MESQNSDEQASNTLGSKSDNYSPCFTYKSKEDELKVAFRVSNDKTCLNIRLDDEKNLEQYYEGTFQLAAITLGDFFNDASQFAQYVQANINGKQSTVEFNATPQGHIILVIGIIFIKKQQKIQFFLEKRPISELVKQTRLLKKFQSQNRTKKILLQEGLAAQKLIDQELLNVERQLGILKKENDKILEDYSNQLQFQLTELEKLKVMQDELINKKHQILILYYEIFKQGTIFSQQEKQKLEKILNENNRIRKRKFCQDNGSEASIISNTIEENHPMQQKILIPSQDDKVNKDNQVIVINSQTESINESDDKADVNNIKNRTDKDTAKLENLIPRPSQRRLQIKDNDSNQEQCPSVHELDSISKKNIEFLESNKPIEEKQNRQQAALVCQEQNSPKGQQNLQIVIQSSEEDEDWEHIGQKVQLDFSKSKNIGKYKFQFEKNGVFIERIFDDSNFYHILHKQPIKAKENMQFTIINIQKKDWTFGIMSKDVVLVSRLEWSSKNSICWVGCGNFIFPDNQGRHVHRLQCQHLKQSDCVAVVVDTIAKIIRFFLNRKLIYQREIPQNILKQCYFFIETATIGNKIFYKHQ